jgi:hypothetical protein
MESFTEKSVQNDNRKEIIILSSIFGVICLVFLCLMVGLYYGITKINKREQALKATEQAFKVTQQAQGTVTAVHQATQVAEYEFFDGFRNNLNFWDTGPQENDYWSGNMKVREGAYIWEIEELHISGFYSWGGWAANQAVGDFDLSVDAKLATPEAVDLCYGVNFRTSPKDVAEGFYAFTVCDDQKFFVKYDSDLDGDALLVPWTRSQAIHSGDWNTLAISARGDHFVLSINNTVVADFTDAHLRRGYAYLVLNANDSIPGTIMFDNFALQTR